MKNQNKYEVMGRRVGQMRRQLGMGSDEFARKACIHVGDLTVLEQGQARLTQAQWQDIAHALGLEDLTYGRGPRSLTMGDIEAFLLQDTEEDPIGGDNE